MYHLFLVAIGGAVGSALRHLVNLAALRLGGPGFPWGTLTVNVVGCLAMGMLVELIARRFGASAEMRLVLATGLLGGFTTFSAFALDTVTLWERGAMVQAAGYVLASVVVSLAALVAGLWLARGLA